MEILEFKNKIIKMKSSLNRIIAVRKRKRKVQ